MIALRLMGMGEAMPLPAPSSRPQRPAVWLHKRSGATESIPAPSGVGRVNTSHGKALGTEKPPDTGCCFWCPICRLWAWRRLEAGLWPPAARVK